MRERWTSASLGDVVEVMRNGINCTQDKSGNGYKVTRIETISNGKVDLTRVGYANLSAVERERFRLKSGDILFSHINSNLHVGKTAILAEGMDLYHGVNLMLIRPKTAVDPKYLERYLKFLFAGGYWRAVCKQSVNQASVNQVDIKQVPIEFPSLPEQKRIVAILDEAFEGLALAAANAEKNLKNARQLFDSYLRDAFMQYESDHSKVAIGEIADVFDGPHATPKTVESGPIFLGISALQDGQVNLRETRHVTKEDFKQWTRRVKPEPGDVVFSYETRLGQVAIIPPDFECCLGRRMGLVRVDRTKGDPKYFVYQYMSLPFQKFLKARTVKGATVDRISIRDFPSFLVCLPPLTEQNRIVSALDRLGADTGLLEMAYRKKVSALTELKQSLLAKAFAGDLT